MAKQNLTFSIIIPLYVINERFFDDLKKFEKLRYNKKEFEILIVSDKNIEIPKLKDIDISLLLTKKKKTGPAKKRDLALRYAKGEICAFIDDDAYPDSHWLQNAEKAFKNNNAVAIGGPGVTPPEDGKWEQIAGLIYESYFCSGATQYRFIPQQARFTEDFPAYNLFVKKDVLKRVGGYGNDFYGGEDTFLCAKLIKVGKIYYDPSIVVYHHRRKLFFGLLQQIANVGLHRGYFAKKYPETSRLWFYFIPSILALSFFIFLFLAIIYHTLLPLFIVCLLFFILMGSFSVYGKATIGDAIMVGLGIILVHISYGLNFIRGLFINELQQ